MTIDEWKKEVEELAYKAFTEKITEKKFYDEMYTMMDKFPYKSKESSVQDIIDADNKGRS